MLKVEVRQFNNLHLMERRPRGRICPLLGKSFRAFLLFGKVKTMGEDLLTRKAAAAELGVCPETIGRRIRTGELPSYLLGSDRRQRYVRREDLARLSEPTLATPSRGPQAATSATPS